MTDDEFKASFHTVRDDVSEIKSALLGDKFGSKGIVHRVSAVEQTTAELHNRIVYWSGGLFVAAGLGGFFLKIILKG